jgi:tetratricopeptide (TPR) repeat protein
MVSGSGDEVERSALTALEIGQDAGQPDAFVWFAPQVWFARGAQGRLAEVLDLVRQQIADNPGLPAWLAGLAVTLVRIGEPDEAAELVAAMMADSSKVFPYDPIWLFGHTSLGEAVACVGTPEQAAEEYARLAPYADRIPYVGVCTAMSVNRVLGNLAARAGKRELADEHFARAKAEHERLGAPEWVARTELEWGRFLLDGGEPERARALLAKSLEGARRIGAADVARAAGSLLAAIAEASDR